jgi:hypothetical protein
MKNVDQGGVKTKDSVRIALSSFGNEQLAPIAEAGPVNPKILLGDVRLGSRDCRVCSIKPGFAENWEVYEDGLTWTLHLRNGVQFDDGWGGVTAPRRGVQHYALFGSGRPMRRGSNSGPQDRQH